MSKKGQPRALDDLLNEVADVFREMGSKDGVQREQQIPSVESDSREQKLKRLRAARMHKNSQRTNVAAWAIEEAQMRSGTSLGIDTSAVPKGRKACKAVSKTAATNSSATTTTTAAATGMVAGSRRRRRKTRLQRSEAQRSAGIAAEVSRARDFVSKVASGQDKDGKVKDDDGADDGDDGHDDDTEDSDDGIIELPPLEDEERDIAKREGDAGL